LPPTIAWISPREAWKLQPSSARVTPKTLRTPIAEMPPDADGGAEAEAVRALGAAGVRVLPGDAFGASGRGWLRSTFAVPDDELVGGFTRVGQVLATQGMQRNRTTQRRRPPCRVSSSTT